MGLFGSRREKLAKVAAPLGLAEVAATVLFARWPFALRERAEQHRAFHRIQSTFGGMLDGAPEIPAPPRRLQGIGNTDEGVYAAAGGFFMPSVGLLDSVRAGEPIGRIVDQLGEVLATPVAPADGVVGLLRELPPVDEGDVLLLVATPEEA